MNAPIFSNFAAAVRTLGISLCALFLAVPVAAQVMSFTGASPTFFTGPGQTITFNLTFGQSNAITSSITLLGMNYPPATPLVCAGLPLQPGGNTTCSFTYVTQAADSFDITQFGQFRAVDPNGVPRTGNISNQQVVTFVQPDTTPDAFSFTAQTGVALSTVVTSNTVTITGINTAAPISISGGQYSIGCTATFTSTAGTINNNQTVCVRQTSSASFSTTTTTALTIGGVVGNFAVTTLAADTTPDAFSFTAQTGVALSTAVTSNTVTISGLNTAAPISVSGGQYSIGCTATFTSTAGTINNNQTVCVRQTSSASPNTTTTATLTIGGVAGNFAVTTVAADTTPDAFSFTAQTGVAPNAVITSNTVTITGINTAAPISVTGGEYSIGCTATFASTAGTISNNQTVCVRQTSSASFNTTTTATLTIGGVAGNFQVTTGCETNPIVSTVSDSGAGSLRQAIANACPDSTVTFSVTGTITLTSGELRIDKNLTVQGPGAGQLTVSGNGTSRVFRTTATVTLSGMTITGGNGVGTDAGFGGGLLAAGGALSLDDCVVANNSTSGAGGGLAAAFGTLNVNRTTISGNTADQAGGIYAQDQVTVIRDSTVSTNSGANGEGLRNTAAGGNATLTLINSTVSGNTPSGQNSAIRSEAGSSGLTSTVNVINSTITGNSTSAAGQNGAVWVRPGPGTHVVTLTNTIVSGNTSGGVANDLEGTFEAASAFNLIGTGGNLANGVNGNIVGVNDPQLGPLADNGGPTKTHALLIGSPAIDKGSAVAGVTTDQRGQPRPFDDAAVPNASGGNGSDIGAFESQVTVDTTPDAFSFTAQTGVALNTAITSNTVTITGLNTGAPISVTGGEYSTGCTATFTSAAGTINNNQTVCVRQTSSASFSTSTTARLTIGGVASDFTVTTLAADTTPDAFSFTAQTGVALSTAVTSNTVTITGLNTGAAISVTGGEYSIGCSATFTSAAGTINNNQTVCVRQTSSASFNTTTTAALTIGGVVGNFAVTTLSADTTPDAFSFTAQTGVALSTAVTSNTVTITGLNTGAPISVTSGEYSVGCTATFTSAAGTINNNQTVCVRQTSSVSFATTTTATLTIGGVAGNFAVTTLGADTTPDAFSFTPQSNAALNTVVTSNTVNITGLNTAAPVSVSGGEYSIGCTATFTSAAGTINNNQTVCVRQTSSASFAATTTATLTIGGVAGDFAVTTLGADTAPDAFSFTALTGVARNTVVTSNTVTITGLNTSSPVTVAGGEYSIGCTATFTAAAGTINNNDTVCLRHTSAATFGADTTTTLTIGGVNGIFRSTTLACNASDPSADTDGDGIPNGVETQVGTDACVKDNDVLGNTRLYVMQLYRDLFDREADAGGLAFWQGEMDANRLSRAQVLDQMLRTPESQDFIAPVTRLYFANFLRVPDRDGLLFWVNQYKGGLAAFVDISNFFVISPEFQQRYGSLSNDAFVQLVYQNVLGRAPDAGGLAFWVDELNSGRRSRGAMMAGFSESLEHKQISANEVYVISAYIGTLDRAPTQAEFNRWVQNLDDGQSALDLINELVGLPEYRQRFLP